nr:MULTISPECIES: palindromic element RPE4 domain-containing protein [spotted fever group]
MSSRGLTTGSSKTIYSAFNSYIFSGSPWSSHGMTMESNDTLPL